MIGREDAAYIIAAVATVALLLLLLVSILFPEVKP
jgi:hypothetical protein